MLIYLKSYVVLISKYIVRSGFPRIWFSRFLELAFIKDHRSTMFSAVGERGPDEV